MSETNAPHAPAGLAHPFASAIDVRLDLETATALGEHAVRPPTIVASVGGRIEVEQGRARGTAFRIELPALAPQRSLDLASAAGSGVLLAERAPGGVEGRGARS
jgi:hypothetical protein